MLHLYFSFSLVWLPPAGGTQRMNLLWLLSYSFVSLVVSVQSTFATTI